MVRPLARNLSRRQHEVHFKLGRPDHDLLDELGQEGPPVGGVERIEAVSEELCVREDGLLLRRGGTARRGLGGEVGDAAL